MTVSLTVIPVWRWSSLGTVQIPSGPLMTSMNLPEYILLNLVDISVQFYLKTHVFLSSLLETSMIIFSPCLSFCFLFCLFSETESYHAAQDNPELTAVLLVQVPTFRDCRYAPPYSAAGPLLFPSSHPSRTLTSCLSICLSVDATALYVFM